MSLDRHHLQLLAAIARHRQLGAAARSINLSPSAASRRVSEAERRLGIALVETVGRTVELTAAGRHLAEVGSATERQISAAELSARWIDQGEADRVLVGLGFHDSPAWTEALLGPLVRDHRVGLVRTSEGGALEALRSGEVDVLVDTVAATPAGVRVTRLGTDRLVGVLAADHPLARAGRDLEARHFDGATLLVSHRAPKPGFELDRFFLGGEAFPETIEQVESLETMLGMVGRGFGTTIQPEKAVACSGAAGDLALRPLSPQPRVDWVTLTRHEADPATAAVVDRVAGAFGSRVLSATRDPATGAAGATARAPSPGSG